MFDFLRTAGSALVGADKATFDQIKELFDHATTDLLIGPDWTANMAAVDALVTVQSTVVLNELLFYLRNSKLKSKYPKTVYLALILIETLVKNCSARVHQAVNDKDFMAAMGAVVRKYNHSPSSAGSASASFAAAGENRDVAEASIDIVQAWGTAFLEYRHVYPNIVSTYNDLRREGFRFKPQADPARMPTVTGPPLAAASPQYQQQQQQQQQQYMRPHHHQHASTARQQQHPAATGDNNQGQGVVDEDAILAAAMQASMMDYIQDQQQGHDQGQGQRASSAGAGGGSSTREWASASAAAPSSASPALLPPSASASASLTVVTEALDGLRASVTLMHDMLVNGGSVSDLRSNKEFLSELAAQLSQGQYTLTQRYLETALTSFPELVEPIVTETGRAGRLTQLWEDILKGRVQSVPVPIFEEEKKETAPAPPVAISEASNDIFSIFDSNDPVVPAPSSSANVKGSSNSSNSSSTALFKLKPPPGSSAVTADSSSSYNMMHQQQQRLSQPPRQQQTPPTSRTVSAETPTSTFVAAAADPFGLGGIDFNLPAPAAAAAVVPTRRPSGGGVAVLLPPPPGSGNTHRRPSATASPPAPVPASNNNSSSGSSTLDLFADMSATGITAAATTTASTSTSTAVGIATATSSTDNNSNPFDLF